MKYSINLASRSYVNKRGLYTVYLLCGILLAVGLFFNAGYYLELREQIDMTRKRLADLEEKIMANQGGKVDYDEEKYQQILREIKMANAILQRDAFRWTKLLDQLEQVVPGNVKIENIKPDHSDRSVDISGTAKTLKDMNRFLDNLIESGFYREILLLNQAVVENNGVKRGIRFSVVLQGAF